MINIYLDNRDGNLQGWKLVKQLVKSGVIVRVPNDGADEINPLDPTEERMIFDNLWAHFWPTDNQNNRTGLSGVMLHILKEAKPLRIEFSRQVDSVNENSGKFWVKSSESSDGSLHTDEADIVIVTIPSVQARDLIGHLLPDFVSKDLGKIQYESRAACSLVARMSPKSALRVCQVFGPDKTEINFELASDISKLHLIAWQDRKYKTYEAIKASLEVKGESDTVDLTFTIHSTAATFDTFASKEEIESYVQSILKNLISCKEKSEDIDIVEGGKEDLEVVKSRGVLWQYSQPTGPMETLYTEVLNQTNDINTWYSNSMMVLLNLNSIVL